jgi:hypothetical protein
MEGNVMRLKLHMDEARSTLKKNFDIPMGAKAEKVYSDKGVALATVKGKNIPIGNMPSKGNYEIISWFQNNQKIVAKLKRKTNESRTILGDPIKSKAPTHPSDKYDTVEDIAAKLKKNCSQILRIYKTYAPLWRGTSKWELYNPIEQHKGHVGTGRDPKDTPKVIHDYLNAGMKKKIGWNVRDGVPVSTDWEQSKNYGDPQIFFPFNGFKWAYVKSSRDVFITLDDMVYNALTKGLKRITALDIKKEEWLRNEMDRIIANTTNKPWTKGHHGEIFFNVKQYYLYDPRYIGFTLDKHDEPVDGNDRLFDDLGIFPRQADRSEIARAS